MMNRARKGLLRGSGRLLQLCSTANNSNDSITNKVNDINQRLLVAVAVTVA